jgi:8-oxo-dGTP diphosphatase
VFDGAKAALFIGPRLLVIRRDARPGLRFSGMLDFPGGGREGTETPEETLLREVREEVGLRLDPDLLGWRRELPAAHIPDAVIWFFAVHLPAGSETGIVFGDEGQGWNLMTPAAFLAAEDAIPSLKARLRMYLAERG